ncbi:MAG: response regulator transcription factor, partial [Clostridia bacterium]|nr:response regulator transcription factor [Clostridia bacterium]
MVKILVVEDDKDLNKLVCTYLRGCGYEVSACFDGEEAIEMMGQKQFNMVISDIMMPKMDGFELAESIRSFDTQIPILFMSAKDDKPSKMLGYKIGIDDYVVKPFDIDVLIMKVNALLRRAKIETEKKITIGNLVMDIEEHTAYVNGEEISLTVREFNLLFKLLQYPKKTFTRSALMEEFWDYDSSATSRTVDVYMAKIREKTAECDGFEIITVHGLGYKAV